MGKARLEEDFGLSLEREPDAEGPEVGCALCREQEGEWVLLGAGVVGGEDGG